MKYKALLAAIQIVNAVYMVTIGALIVLIGYDITTGFEVYRDSAVTGIGVGLVVSLPFLLVWGSLSNEELKQLKNKGE